MELIFPICQLLGVLQGKTTQTFPQVCIHFTATIQLWSLSELQSNWCCCEFHIWAFFSSSWRTAETRMGFECMCWESTLFLCKPTGCQQTVTSSGSTFALFENQLCKTGKTVMWQDDSCTCLCNDLSEPDSVPHNKTMSGQSPRFSLVSRWV